MRQRDWQVLSGIALFYIVLESLGITCPIRFLTGVSCAGCGMSRAWLSVLRLDLAGAFSCHPLFWLVPIAGIVFLFRKRLPRRAVQIFLYATCAAFLVVYVIRMLLPGDSIVVFAPWESLPARVITWIRSGL